ncbi:formylglycine-generating enzyme family protein [Sandaracinus amylolyticus]|nr:SUMF1/EgtB/PvdO family nonheme iron enzyme [Sandaracinus amylolyticus]
MPDGRGWWLLLACAFSSACGGESFELDASSGDGGEAHGNDASDSGGSTECSTPGELRTTGCGRCGAGTMTQLCSAERIWRDQGVCSSDEECVPGSTETAQNELCGISTRSCDEHCTWREWQLETPDGECVAGTERMTSSPSCTGGLAIAQRCTSTCAWQDISDRCVDPCGDLPRSSPRGHEEICIPGGPFVRGHPEVPSASTVSTVEISSFYIDQFPVTNARYRACVAAGGCTAPLTSTGLISYEDVSRGAHPVQGVTWDQASAFCAWDGARRLPTEAEYEKAARGPAPRSQRYTWDVDEFRCSVLPSLGCPGYSVPAGRAPYVDAEVGSMPESRSSYGVEMLIGAAYHWTADWYSETYYDDPSSREIDPQGPATGSARVVRGSSRNHGSYGQHHVSQRQGRPPGEPREPTTFRCVRTAP